MLGISTPDAIALGTLILAALAAWQGRRSGEVARRAAAPEGLAVIGGAIVDHMIMRDLVEAIRGLDGTIGRAIDGRRSRETADLDALVERLQVALDRRHPSVRSGPPGRDAAIDASRDVRQHT